MNIWLNISFKYCQNAFIWRRSHFSQYAILNFDGLLHVRDFHGLNCKNSNQNRQLSRSHTHTHTQTHTHTLFFLCTMWLVMEISTLSGKCAIYAWNLQDFLIIWYEKVTAELPRNHIFPPVVKSTRTITSIYTVQNMCKNCSFRGATACR